MHASAQRADASIAWFRHYAETRIDSRLIDERRTIPPYVVLDFGNHGLLGLQAPVESGGLALTHRDAFRVLEQVAAFDFTLGSFLGVHNALGLRPLLQFGSDAQKRELLPIIASGRELASFAYTEPAAGSNPGAIESTATPDGNGGWILRGTKKWIGTAAWSGFTHVFAHVLDEHGKHRGIGTFIVRQGTPRFLQGPEELTMGMRGMVQNTVELHDVRVTQADVLGAAGEGMHIAQDAMEFGRTCIAACAVGMMKRSAQLMTRYARQRSMATGRLIDNIVTRERLTQLTTETSALEVFVQTFAQWMDDKLDIPKECFAALKALAAESAFTAVDGLMQLLGGRGFIETNIAPQMLRDVRLMRIFEGPSETMQMFVGTRIAATSPSFFAFLRNQLRATDIATQLEDAARTSKSRDAQRNAMLLGEAGMFGLWLAVVEASDIRGAVGLAPPKQAGQAPPLHSLWLRQRFTTAINNALAHDHKEPLDADALERIVASYANDIGDIEQYRPGVLQDVDPFLRRDPHTARAATLPIRKHAEPHVASTNFAKRDAVIAWLRNWIAQRLGSDLQTIGITTPFADMGLDSVTAVELTHQLQKAQSIEVAPTATWDFPNILALAEHATANVITSNDETASLDTLSEGELASLLAGELNAR